MSGDRIIRPAREDELPRLVELVADQHSADDAREAQVLCDSADHGAAGWTVAEVDGRIAAFLTELPIRGRIGPVDVPARTLEFVTAAPDHEGRGHVRALFEHVHRGATERGVLLHVLVGIPYYYRRLGYEYAMSAAPTTAVDAVPDPPRDVTVRTATTADVPVLQRLTEWVQRPADVVFAHAGEQWSWLLASPCYEVLMAERDGEAVGTARLQLDEDPVPLLDVAARDPGALGALVARAARHGRGGVEVVGRADPDLQGWIDRLGRTTASDDAYYARVSDTDRLLRRLAPLFEQRLRGAGLDDLDADVLLSSYARSRRLVIRESRIVDVAAGGRVAAPVSAGGIGVPPDLMTSLIVGPHGLAGLATRHPDVLPGSLHELGEVLFPPMRSDVMTWVAC